MNIQVTASAAQATQTGIPLMAKYVPSARGAGGVLTVVNQDSGRVVIETPVLPDQPSSDAPATAATVNITA
jgi:hypothetical protein